MNNSQFSISYYGHPAAVTILDDNNYVAQVTYKPLYMQRKKNPDGTENWVERDTQLETSFTKEIGRLMAEQLYSVEHS